MWVMLAMVTGGFGVAGRGAAGDPGIAAAAFPEGSVVGAAVASGRRRLGPVLAGVVGPLPVGVVSAGLSAPDGEPADATGSGGPAASGVPVATVESGRDVDGAWLGDPWEVPAVAGGTWATP
jgi:hypothetical protein